MDKLRQALLGFSLVAALVPWSVGENATAASSAASSTASSVVAPPAHALSHRRERAYAEAGDSNHFAYLTEDGVGHNGYANWQLHVVDRTGRQQRVLARSDAGLGSPVGLLGDLVSAPNGKDAATGKLEVSWWSIDSDAHGSTDIPDGTTYLAAYRDGWLLGMYDGDALGPHLYAETTDGAVTDLGAPFITEDVHQVAIGPSGFVASDGNGHFRYATYADPGAYLSLQVGTFLGDGNCNAVGTTTAACSSWPQGEDSPTTGTTTIVRLDGGAPIAQCQSLTCASQGSVAVNHHGVTFVSGTAAHSTRTLSRDGTLSPAPKAGHGLHRAYAIPALGGLVGRGGSPNTFSVVTTGDARPRPVATIPYERARVSAVWIAAGQLIYVDDESGPHGGFSIWRQPLAAAAPDGRRHRATSMRHQRPIAAGARTTVTAARTPARGRPSGYVLAIRSAYGSRILHASGDPPQVSGRRVLYATSARGPASVRVHVLDLRTGSTVTLSSLLAPSGAHVNAPSAFPAALFGRTLAYALPNGSVHVRDLVTGADRTVAPAPSQQPTGERVFLSGDEVGWSFGDPTHGAPVVAAYRNWRTMSRPVVIDDGTQPTGQLRDLDGLSDAGAIVRSPGHTWELAPYGATHGPVIVRSATVAQPPVVADGQAVWLTTTGKVTATTVARPSS